MTTHHEPAHKLTVKIGDALRTIQGYTHDEYVIARVHLMDDMQADLEAVQMAKAVTAAAPLTKPAPAVTAPVAAPAAPPSDWNPSGPPPQVASFQQAAVPQCAHGPRTPRSGSGAKGPWRGWFCPTAKGTPDQCSPTFINRGTPEWNDFPA